MRDTKRPYSEGNIGKVFAEVHTRSVRTFVLSFVIFVNIFGEAIARAQVIGFDPNTVAGSGFVYPVDANTPSINIPADINDLGKLVPDILTFDINDINFTEAKTVVPVIEDPNRYLNAVREFADNVLKYGRDTYGPKHTPLFVDGVNVNTHEPVKWIAPNGDRWILSNLASQQNLFRTLDGLSRITGDPKYKQAAMDAIKYAFENLRSPNGLLYWGVCAAYDAQTDEVYALFDQHCLKWHYPHYELMWEVNPEATKQLIESFWSAHILDWSNLDMDRLSKLSRPLGQPWQHKYEGGPVYFQSSRSDAVAYVATGSSLCQAAAILYKLSGEHEPLVWGKRLAHRYVETRNPKIGISGYVYSRMKADNVPRYLGDDFKGHVLLRGTLFPAYLGWCNTVVRELVPGYLNVTPGTPFSLTTGCWIWQLLLGEMLGADGGEFTQGALEELTALGKVAYRKNDNSFIPMLIDGTSLEGYVCKRNGYDGPKGSMFKSIEAVSMDFWAYALAYRITEDGFMWEMARNIALGQDFGDIGISPTNKPNLQKETVSSDPFALLSFLELYKKTSNKAFLEMAERIGNNILVNRLQEGFFIASARHIYARFDAVEPLVLLHLHMATKAKGYAGPRIWPHRPLFTTSPYRSRMWASDYAVIYNLTESPYPPRSLEEAAVTGDVGEVKSLISQGVDVDVLSEDVWYTPLHRAVLMGRYKVVELLLAEGADADMGSCHGATALHFVAEKGHTEMAELLITNGADVNATNNRGSTPLYYAAMNGHKDIVDLLVEKGAMISTIHLAAYIGDLAKIKAFIQEGIDVNALDGEGYAPLHFLAKTGQVDVAEFLIAKGANVNVKGIEGSTPLHSAANGGHTEVAQVLIARNATVNVKNEEGDTPLHVAARIGHRDILELLIANGADVNAKNNDGQAPIDVAVSRNRSEVVKLLIAKGADVSLHTAARFGDLAIVKSLMEKSANINEKDALGKTPLHYAAESGHKDIVELLIAKGADINAKNNEGQTALDIAMAKYDQEIVKLFIANRTEVSVHVAAFIGDVDKVKDFIESGGSVDVVDVSGQTLLHLAAAGNHKDIAELLISNGADVNVVVDEWRTPLGAAAQTGSIDVAEYLIAHGANVNGREGHWTPLQEAAYYSEDMVELLLTKGANINAGKWTALHGALDAERFDIVELLLAKGADVNIRDGQGHTPLHIAASYAAKNNPKVVELLISKGADINAKDNKGKTALAYAVEKDYTEIAEILRKHGAKDKEEEKAPESAPAPKEETTVDPNAVELNEPDGDIISKEDLRFNPPSQMPAVLTGTWCETSHSTADRNRPGNRES